MAIHLNPSEEIRAEGKIHWLTYVRPAITSVAIILFAIFGAGATAYNNSDMPAGAKAAWFGIAVLSVIPMFVRWLQNKCTVYVVTNQRVYFQEGILSRYSSDIPLEKINDVSLRQNLLQRIFGAGTVTVLTGNDVFTAFNNLSNLEAFRAAIRRK